MNMMAEAISAAQCLRRQACQALKAPRESVEVAFESQWAGRRVRSEASTTAVVSRVDDSIHSCAWSRECVGIEQ